MTLSSPSSNRSAAARCVRAVADPLREELRWLPEQAYDEFTDCPAWDPRAVELLVEHLSRNSHPISGLLASMGTTAREHLFQVATDESEPRPTRSSAASALA
jgi:hypothetical protein